MFSNRSRSNSSSSKNSTNPSNSKANSEIHSNRQDTSSSGYEILNGVTDAQALELLEELLNSFNKYQDRNVQDEKFHKVNGYQFYKLGRVMDIKNSVVTMELQATSVDRILKQLLNGIHIITQDHMKQLKSIVESDDASNIPPHVVSRDAINTIKEILNMELHKGEMEFKAKESKYDNQIIIDYGRGATSEGLEKKRQFIYDKASNIYPIETMVEILQAAKEGTLDNPTLNEFLALITPKTRIYLVGHNLRNEAIVSEDENGERNSFTLSDLVFLIRLTSQRMQVTDLNQYNGPLLKISFVSCKSKLLAYNCAHMLRNERIPAEVTGRDAYQLSGIYFLHSHNYHKLSGDDEIYWHKYKTVSIDTTDKNLTIKYKSESIKPTDIDSHKRANESDSHPHEDSSDDTTSEHVDKKVKLSF